jgi:hypothetical protein
MTARGARAAAKKAGGKYMQRQMEEHWKEQEERSRG